MTTIILVTDIKKLLTNLDPQKFPTCPPIISIFYLSLSYLFSIFLCIWLVVTRKIYGMSQKFFILFFFSVFIHFLMNIKCIYCDYILIVNCNFRMFNFVSEFMQCKFMHDVYILAYKLRITNGY